MANKQNTSKHPKVSQKRVAVVLASLVGTMTVSAAALLLMEGPSGALSYTIPTAYAPEGNSIASQIALSQPLQPKPWSYIIIYESSDPAATAATLADDSFTGGSPHNSGRPKANFHFVIDGPDSGNGTMDGKLEVTTSWKQQNTGAPYAAWPDHRSYSYTPYTNAIGVCLSADLNRKPLSEPQHQKLLQLVRTLASQFNIPKENVLFQWDRRLNAKTATAVETSYDLSFRSQLD